MPLLDHFRELRARVLRALLVFIAAMALFLFVYETLFAVVLQPYNSALERLGEKVQSEPVFIGVATPLMLQLKLAALAAAVFTSPYWLYQIWAFVLPGLQAHERKWSRVFLAVAGPLFLTGVALGYIVLPKALEVLIGFTPANTQNFVEFGDYFSFLVRMLLIFGIAFEIPVFVVLLNLAGVLSGKAIGAHRPWIIVGTFVFAAIATPSTDPFSMVMLALPMTFLFAVSEVVARLMDSRRSAEVSAALSDDVASSLDHVPEDVTRSDLEDEQPR